MILSQGKTAAALRRVVGLTFVAAAVMLNLARSEAVADEATWRLLSSGGRVVLIRHAVTTPGSGDSNGMRLEHCATQRNLTEAGRDQARRLGAAFERRAVVVDEVLSSPWCRCLETARLAFGRVEVWVPLANLFQRREHEPQQVGEMRRRISTWKGRGNLVLVSHGSTIAALTGVYLAPAEVLVITPGKTIGFVVEGRISVE
jgi:broad specificity phosphatase PhoE